MVQATLSASSSQSQQPVVGLKPVDGQSLSALQTPEAKEVVEFIQGVMRSEITLDAKIDLVNQASRYALEQLKIEIVTISSGNITLEALTNRASVGSLTDAQVKEEVKAIQRELGEVSEVIKLVNKKSDNDTEFLVASQIALTKIESAHSQLDAVKTSSDLQEVLKSSLNYIAVREAQDTLLKAGEVLDNYRGDSRRAIEKLLKSAGIVLDFITADASREMLDTLRGASKALTSLTKIEGFYAGDSSVSSALISEESDPLKMLTRSLVDFAHAARRRQEQEISGDASSINETGAKYILANMQSAVDGVQSNNIVPFARKAELAVSI
jgi:hypothetical protein